MALALYRKETHVEMHYQKKRLRLYSQTAGYLLPGLIKKKKIELKLQSRKKKNDKKGNQRLQSSRRQLYGATFVIL